MAKDTFQLDIDAAGAQILQDMAANIVNTSAEAIMARAGSMASAQSSEAPGYRLSNRVGIIRKGTRAIATITVNDTGNAHALYIARQALIKAKDAGRV
jgi:hypothetical protein